MRALSLFRGRRDATGTFLAWSAAANAYVYEGRDMSPLDRWIPLLEDLLGDFPQSPSRTVEEQVVTEHVRVSRMAAAR
jgi:hypothetical protein